MNRSILVTGGTGFVGKNLCIHLQNQGYNLFLLIQDYEIDKIKEKKQNGIRWEELIKKEEVKDIYGNKIKNIDTVIHLASYGVNNLDDDFDKMIDVNINLTLKLIKSLQKINCRKIIFTGSCFEYKYKAGKLTEEDVLNNNTGYSTTKSSGILLADYLAKSLGIKTITLRLFNIFGDFEKENRLLPSIFKNESNFIPFSGGEQIRDFLYIKDIVLAYEKILEKDILDGEIYNVCSGKGISIKDFVLIAAKVSKIPLEYLKFGEYEYRQGEPMCIVGDNEKFCQKFEWKPSFSLEEGIKRMYENISR